MCKSIPRDIPKLPKKYVGPHPLPGHHGTPMRQLKRGLGADGKTYTFSSRLSTFFFTEIRGVGKKLIRKEFLSRRGDHLFF